MTYAIESSYSNSFVSSKKMDESLEFSNSRKAPLGLASYATSSMTTVEKDCEIKELLQGQAPLFLSTKKHTSKQTIPDFIYIELTESLYSIGKDLLGSADFEVDVLCENLKKHMKSSAEILEESLKKSQEFGTWKILEKIGLCLLGAFNFIFGGAAIASGSPAIGSALVATAVLSTANLAMTEMHGWDYLAKRLSQENKKLEEELRLYLPLVSTLLGAALTAGTSSLAISNNLLHSINVSGNSGETIRKAILFYTTFSSAGKMFTEGKQQWIQTDLSQVQDKIEEETFYKDLLTTWLKDFFQNLNDGWESTKTIIEIGTKKRMAP